MSSLSAAEIAVTGTDQGIVIGVAVVALVALVIAFILRAGVLAAGQGTARMQEISAAVQEGAAVAGCGHSTARPKTIANLITSNLLIGATRPRGAPGVFGVGFPCRKA